MATKSKAQLELEALQKEFAAYKDKVRATVERCNEDYSLDLCEDGLEDFFNTLGIKWHPKREGELTVSANGFDVPMVDRYVIDDKVYSNIVDRVENSIGDILRDVLGDDAYDAYICVDLSA
jgi:hypothetical protein